MQPPKDRLDLLEFLQDGRSTRSDVDLENCPRVISDRDPGTGSCMGFDDLGEPANYSPGETRPR